MHRPRCPSSLAGVRPKRRHRRWRCERCPIRRCFAGSPPRGSGLRLERFSPWTRLEEIARMSRNRMGERVGNLLLRRRASDSRLRRLWSLCGDCMRDATDAGAGRVQVTVGARAFDVPNEQPPLWSYYRLFVDSTTALAVSRRRTPPPLGKRRRGVGVVSGGPQAGLRCSSPQRRRLGQSGDGNSWQARLARLATPGPRDLCCSGRGCASTWWLESPSHVYLRRPPRTCRDTRGGDRRSERVPCPYSWADRVGTP